MKSPQLPRPSYHPLHFLLTSPSSSICPIHRPHHRKVQYKAKEMLLRTPPLDLLATRSVVRPTPRACGVRIPLLQSSPVNGNTTSSPRVIGRTTQTLIPAIGKSAHQTTTSTCR